MSKFFGLIYPYHVRYYYTASLLDYIFLTFTRKVLSQTSGYIKYFYIIYFYNFFPHQFGSYFKDFSILCFTSFLHFPLCMFPATFNLIQTYELVLILIGDSFFLTTNYMYYLCCCFGWFVDLQLTQHLSLIFFFLLFHLADNLIPSNKLNLVVGNMVKLLQCESR